ncbi:MAG: hypothetical protein K2P81_15015 [Bacteriovoracaceae bacterium]|nr:hypothetical protein [Bacteriovoracaceae bacterium]
MNTYFRHMHYLMLLVLGAHVLNKFSAIDLADYFNHSSAQMSWFSFTFSLLALLVFTTKRFNLKIIQLGLALSGFSMFYSLMSLFFDLSILPSSVMSSLFFLSFYTFHYFHYLNKIKLIQTISNYLMFVIITSVFLGFILKMPLLYSQLTQNSRIGVSTLTFLSMIIVFLKTNFYTPSLVTVCSWSQTVKFNDEWVSPMKYLQKQYHVTHGISPEEKEKLMNALKKPD